MKNLISKNPSAEDMSLTARLKSISIIYLLIIALIAGVGCLVLYSAGKGSFSPWAGAHLTRFLISFLIIIIIAVTDLKFWLKHAYSIYAVCLFLLLAVEITGDIGKGAQRWINLGFIQLQPSELMKIAAVLALARYFHTSFQEEVLQNKSLIIPVILIALPVLLVLKQPDLGTAIMLCISAAVIFFLSGVQIWKFVTAALLTAGSIPLIWNFWLHGYQKQRVLTFLNPEKDPLGAGYHILQSYISLGSGGATGKGFLQGTQSYLNFMPEKHTDFVFTVLAEEFGFFGGLILISLYIALIVMGFYIAFRCTSYFGKLVALGLTVNLFSYMAINLSMIMGLVPVVGIPLSLVSYGGTSMLTQMISFGLIQCVYVNKNTFIGRKEAYS